MPTNKNGHSTTISPNSSKVNENESRGMNRFGFKGGKQDKVSLSPVSSNESRKKYESLSKDSRIGKGVTDWKQSQKSYKSFTSQSRSVNKDYNIN